MRAQQPAFRNAAGPIPENKHQHIVQFYESDEFLFDAVTGFIAGGLEVGQPTVIFARPESRRAFSVRLASTGHDYEAACRDGHLIMHDAREALSTFMRGSNVDEARFMDSVGSVIEQVLGSRNLTLRAFGEMVDVLFRDGNVSAAIRLEELWNKLAEKHSFDLLCAYAIGNFYTEAHAQQLKEICRTHSHVVPAESYALLTGDQARAQKVIELQQQARSLQVEIEHRKAIERALRDALAERQAAKEEAEHAAAAKSEFLAVISHELRTPLTAIIGYQELIDHGVGGPVTAQQRVFLSGIKSGASHLLRLIEQILTQSRVGAGKETLHNAPVDMAQLVSACAALMHPLAQENGIELQVYVTRGVTCTTDAGKVQQILLNLLSNAVKFTPSGSITVRFSIDDNNVLIDVIDTGVGIDPAHLDRIFEAFEQIDSTTTRTHSGAGLGLAVSRGLARLMGGDVTARSAVGAGSTFTLRLPLQ